MQYIVPIFALALVMGTSCKKDKQDEEVTPEATITITSPAANDTITGSTFQVTGSITATADIHGYDLKLLKQSDGTEVFSVDVDEHATGFTINTTATPNGVTTATHLRLVVDAILDHQGNKTTKEVVFHYIP